MQAFLYCDRRFKGKKCGFAASTHALNRFQSLIPALSAPVVEDDQQICFEKLQRQIGLTSPLNCQSAINNYLTMKSMAGL